MKHNPQKPKRVVRAGKAWRVGDKCAHYLFGDVHGEVREIYGDAVRVLFGAAAAARHSQFPAHGWFKSSGIVPIQPKRRARK